MSDDHGIQRIVEEIEYLRAKRMRHVGAMPRMVIVHGYQQAVRDCLPGETVEQVSFVLRSHTIPLRLSPTGLVLADVFGRKRPMSLTAAHIERIFVSDPFCVRLGANATSAPRTTLRLTRKTIKTYIRRLRQQIGKALKEAGLAIRSEEVLVSESTDLMNVTAYRLAIPCEFVHLSRTAGRR
jgi:hypothetical protein